MKTKTKDYLNNWVSSINSLIGDTSEEIDKRRKSNIESVKVREDLLCLLNYIEIQICRKQCIGH